jgi:hypothetical protein
VKRQSRRLASLRWIARKNGSNWISQPSRSESNHRSLPTRLVTDGRRVIARSSQPRVRGQRRLALSPRHQPLVTLKLPSSLVAPASQDSPHRSQAPRAPLREAVPPSHPRLPPRPSVLMRPMTTCNWLQKSRLESRGNRQSRCCNRPHRPRRNHRRRKQFHNLLRGRNPKSIGFSANFVAR